MWRNIMVQALYQVAILLVFTFDGKVILGLNHENQEHAEKVKNTFVFNTFVLCQVFNEFNARKPVEMNVFYGVTKNRLFMGIIGITVVLQVLIIEFLGKFTSTVRLNWKLWLVSVAIGVIRGGGGRTMTGSWSSTMCSDSTASLSQRRRDPTMGSWPLALVGKLLPVLEIPFQTYIQSCFCVRRPPQDDDAKGQGDS